MLQGLQVFNAQGSLMLDVTDRVTVLLGQVDTGAVTGSLAVDQFSNGDPWFLAFPLEDLPANARAPRFFVSSNGMLQWVYEGGGNANVNFRIYYGTY